MSPHAARPYACHDTTELERHLRGQRRAFVLVLIACAGVLYGFARLWGVA